MNVILPPTLLCTNPCNPPPPGGDIHSDLKAVYNLPHAMAAPNGLSVEAAHAELQRMGRAHYNLQQVMQVRPGGQAGGERGSTCMENGVAELQG